MLGGLARRVNFIQKMRNEGKPLVVVDSGDLFFRFATSSNPTPSQMQRARLIADGYLRMKVAAINVGQRDLSAGLSFLKEQVRRGLPLISANILNAQDRSLIFKPYLVHRVDGVRVGFIGVVAPELPRVLHERLNGKVEIGNPLEAASRIIKDHGREADIWILLSNAGMGWERRIARAGLGIPFILGSMEGRYISYPIRERGSHILQSYKKGMYVGVLTLKIQDFSSSFADEDREERLEKRLKNLDRRLRALQNAQRKKPSAVIKRAIVRLKAEQKAVEEELSKGSGSPAGANLFKWKLIPLRSSMPEDQVVLGWIRKAGLKKQD